MTKSALVVSTLVLTAFVVSAAQAQVTVEVSKITCEEFASYKVMDHRVQFNENTKKLEEYCLQNPDTLVMQAFEKLAGESK